jgi:hypothetical protein
MRASRLSTRLAAAGTCLFAALAMTSPLQAGETPIYNARMTIKSVEAEPGSTAVVGVTIQVDQVIGSFNINAESLGLPVADIRYDGVLFTNGWEGWDTTPSAAPNISAACIFPIDQVTGFQHLFSFEVEVPADAQPGDYIELRIDDATVTNYSFDTFAMTITNGGIAVMPEADDCPADIAGDNNAVDVADFFMLLTSWGDTDSPADLDHDGTVDTDDMFHLLTSWGPCGG